MQITLLTLISTLFIFTVTANPLPPSPSSSSSSPQPARGTPLFSIIEPTTTTSTPSSSAKAFSIIDSTSTTLTPTTPSTSTTIKSISADPHPTTRAFNTTSTSPPTFRTTIYPAIHPVTLPAASASAANQAKVNGSPYPAFDASNYPHHNFTNPKHGKNCTDPYMKMNKTMASYSPYGSARNATGTASHGTAQHPAEMPDKLTSGEVGSMGGNMGHGAGNAKIAGGSMQKRQVPNKQGKDFNNMAIPGYVKALEKGPAI